MTRSKDRCLVMMSSKEPILVCSTLFSSLGLTPNFASVIQDTFYPDEFAVATVRNNAKEVDMTKFSAALLLSLYFALNLVLTHSNKFLLDKVCSQYGSCPATLLHSSKALFFEVLRAERYFTSWMQNPFICQSNAIIQIHLPFLLTASHAFSSSIGSSIVQHTQRRTDRPSPPLRRHLGLFCFSLLSTINIGVSNMSLAVLSLPLHNTIRALGPAITIALSYAFELKSRVYSRQIYLSLIPIILGVFLVTYGSRYYATPSGLLMAFLSAVLATFKTVLAHHLQTASGDSDNISTMRRLSPLELLSLLSPYSAIQSLILAWYLGEVDLLNSTAELVPVASAIAKGVLAFFNGTCAFLLNLVSFEVNRRVGPLTMAVLANVKQAASLALVYFFAYYAGGECKVNWQQIVGTVVTVCGGIWYAWIERSKT